MRLGQGPKDPVLVKSLDVNAVVCSPLRMVVMPLNCQPPRTRSTPRLEPLPKRFPLPSGNSYR